MSCAAASTHRVAHSARRLLGLPMAITALAATAALVTGILPFPDIEGWLASVSDVLGVWTYPLVGGLAFLEAGAFVGLLAPGETTIVLGGAIAARGEVSLPILMGIAWVGAASGDLVSYVLGRRLGRSFLVAHGPRLRITPERLARVERFFERYGGRAVFLGHFVGIVRAVAPFLAGASRLPLRRFVPYSLLGTGPYAGAFTLVGYAFARSFADAATTVSGVTLAAALLLGLVLVTRGRRRRRRQNPTGVVVP